MQNTRKYRKELWNFKIISYFFFFHLNYFYDQILVALSLLDWLQARITNSVDLLLRGWTLICGMQTIFLI
jgi:hypothetical protein